MKYCIGIMGSPSRPTLEWNDTHLEELKSLGFNAMQLNIAWGWRPNDEALNLQDILVLPDRDEETNRKCQMRQDALRHRLALCKKHGLRTIFHFGAPFNGSDPYDGKPPSNCISDPSVTELYINLLEQMSIQLPGVDDILIYTYDQDAWLCSEFTGCPACRGVPLHKRLPAFLNSLCRKWASINPDGILWWEPWELSSGQSLRIIQELPDKNFGFCAHSNIGEVQKSRPADLWLRNLAMVASRRGIPVVAELFMSEASEETEPLRRVPCPRLTFDQIRTVLSVPGIAGIKEYYGLHPESNDPCLAMVGQALLHPQDDVQTCLARIAAPYGEYAGEMIQMWESVADGYMLYPWDASWFAREIGNASIDHGWCAAFVRGQQCSTPSWDSTRHAIFMKTDNNQPHAWMLEDLQLRCEMAAEAFRAALDMGHSLLPRVPETYRAQMEETLASVEHFMRVCVSYMLHMRETNVAMLLREDQFRKRPLQADLLAEMEQLLMADAENQRHTGRVMTILEAWQKDPGAWLNLYLLPGAGERREGGYFSLTTR